MNEILGDELRIGNSENSVDADHMAQGVWRIAGW